MKATVKDETTVFRKLERNDSLLKFVKGKRWGGLSEFDKLSDDFNRRRGVTAYFSVLTDGKQGLWFQPTERSIVMLVSEPSFGDYRNSIYFMMKDQSDKLQIWKMVYSINTETHKLDTNQAKMLSSKARSFMKNLAGLAKPNDIFFALKAEYRKPGWGGYVS